MLSEAPGLRLYLVSVGGFLVVSLVGYEWVDQPSYPWLVAVAGLLHALAAARLGGTGKVAPVVAIESLLALVGVAAVFLYVVERVPRPSEIWAHAAELSRFLLPSEPSESARYLAQWYAPLLVLSLVVAVSMRKRADSIARAWLAAALALTMASVLFQYSICNPVRRVDLLDPEGQEAFVGALALTSLAEPVAVYGLVLVLGLAFVGFQGFRRSQDHHSPRASSKR